MPSVEKSTIENDDTFWLAWLPWSIKRVWIHLRHLQESALTRRRAQNWPTRLSKQGSNGNQRHPTSFSTGVDNWCAQKIQTKVRRSLRLPIHHRQIP